MQRENIDHNQASRLISYPFIRPAFYYALLKDISGFVRKPCNSPAVHKSQKAKLYDTVGLYLLKFALLIPVVLFFALVYDPENVQSISMRERFSPGIFLLLGGLILPLIEEVGFRLSLVFKPIYLALSAGVFVYYFLTKAVFQTKVTMVDDSFVTRIIAAVFCALILYPLFNLKSIKRRLASFWEQHFAYIFYVISLTFAWMHIVKYEINLTNLLLLPILTLPQLFSAIMYGYTRVKFGFIYPLMLHVCSNTLAITLSILLPGD